MTSVCFFYNSEDTEAFKIISEYSKEFNVECDQNIVQCNSRNGEESLPSIDYSQYQSFLIVATPITSGPALENMLVQLTLSTKTNKDAVIMILSKEIDKFTSSGIPKSARTMMLLGGLVDIEERELYLNEAGKLCLTTAKVVSEVKQSGTVKLNFSKKVPVSSTTTGKPSWKIDLNDDDDDDMIDDDDLLKDNDDILRNKVSKDVMGKSDNTTGCAPTRKACANCSCGRREMEIEEEKARTEGKKVVLDIDDEVKEAPTSSCGSCYKGDAFRCASCPFLGKPAFQPGQEKVILDMDM